MLAMTVLLSFFSFGNVLESYAFLKDIFAGYKILGWHLC